MSLRKTQHSSKSPGTHFYSRFGWGELRIGKDRTTLMVCMGIALFFWLLLKLSQTYRISKSVSVNVRTPVSKTLSNLPPQNMTVQLQGTGWQLLGEQFAGKQLLLTYDASHTDEISISSGQLRQDIQKKLSSTAIRIANINYDHIHVNLEEEVHKKIPIVLNHRLDFAPEHQLKGMPLLKPDSILISGPMTLIGEITAWGTDSLILKDLKNNVRTEITLQRPPDGILLEASKTQAFIEVEAYTAKSLFVPLTIVNAPDSVRIFPDKIKLECTVGLSHYKEVDVSDFKLEVDIGGKSLKEGKTTVPIELKKSPDFVRNIHFTPKAAEFFIFRK